MRLYLHLLEIQFHGVAGLPFVRQHVVPAVSYYYCFAVLVNFFEEEGTPLGFHLFLLDIGDDPGGFYLEHDVSLLLGETLLDLVLALAAGPHLTGLHIGEEGVNLRYLIVQHPFHSLFFSQGDTMSGYAQKGLGEKFNAYSAYFAFGHNFPGGSGAIDENSLDFIDVVCLEVDRDLVTAV